MANMLSPISVHRLHRMLPSDLERLKASASTNEGASSVVDTFRRYLIELREPTAVELDDVARITLQLNSVGLWNVIRPESFIQKVGASLDREVLKTFCDALNVPLAPEADSGADKAARSGSMARFWDRLGREKAPTEGRSPSAGDEAFYMGAIAFWPVSRRLISPTGNRVRLTRMEAHILRVLFEAKKPVSRDVLLREVPVSPRTLDKDMDTLQRKASDVMMGIKVTEAGNYELVTISPDRHK
jgi:hypothetical protein